jgi:hypothetical protein
MDKEQYFKILMVQLSNVLFNGSQRGNKDEILDGIKKILEDYNRIGENVNIKDFRK